jgi:lysine 6-dehydrogenase
MRMLVLGAGRQGAACAYDLLTRTEHEVVIADLVVDRLPDFLAPFLGGRLTTERLDAGEPESARGLMDGATATMSALPYYLNAPMAAAAVEAGSHFCDLGGNTRIVLEQKALHERARERGVSVVPDCGLAPGLVNILAEEGIRRLDAASSVRIMVGGLPQHPSPPLNYQVVYSLEGVLDYYTTPAWVLRDGELVEMEALSEVETVEMEGVGELEAFHTAGGLSLMAQRYRGQIERMEYKTLRYPGHAAAIRVMRDLGLFGLDPVEVKGVPMVPRDLFLATAEPRLRRDPRESPDLVAMRVEVSGTKAGRPVSLRWELVDRYDPATGITAMMRATGFSLAITAGFQAMGLIEPGVWTPDEVVPAQAYVAELGRRGVDIKFSVEG